MLISLVSRWCYLKPCKLPLYEIEGLNLVAVDSDDDEMVLEDHTMDLTVEKLRMRDFLS